MSFEQGQLRGRSGGPERALSAPEGALTSALRSVGRGLLRAPAPLAWGLVVLHGSGIWALSSLSQVGPERDSLLWALLGNAAHAPLFGLLGLFMAGALLQEQEGWARMTPGASLAILGLAGLYGAIDEWHQSFIPGRHPSPFDLGTDIVGVACVLWVVAYLGAEGRSERGLYLRLMFGVLACFGAAGLACFG